MTRRSSGLLGLLVVFVAAAIVAGHSSTPRIDYALVGDWRDESEVCEVTLFADGTWDQNFLVLICGLGSFPKPTRTWTVSGDELHLKTVDAIWPNEGNVTWRAEYAFRRICSILRGQNPVTTQRYLKVEDAQGEVWLVEVTDDVGKEPDRLRRKRELTQFRLPPGASFELDGAADDD